MASVWIDRPCSEPEDLPATCARCGAEATQWKKRNFTWVPPWIGITILAGLIVYIILAIVLRKECKVAVPLCARHKNHWLMRGLLVAGTFFLFIGGGIALAVLTVQLVPKNSDLQGLAVLWPVAGFIAWLVLIIVSNYTAIRAKEITDDRIHLGGVGPEFAEACREREGRRRSLPREAEERWDDRRPRRRDRDEDEPRVRRDEDDRRRDRDDRRRGRDEDDRPRRGRDRDDDY